MLIGSDIGVPLWRQPGSGADWDQSTAVAKRFNAVMAERLAPFGTGVGQMGLATPALGGGLAVSAFELAIAQRVADARSGGADCGGPGEPAAADLVKRLMPPGPGPGADIVEELESKVGELLRERLPVWRSLGVI